MALTQRQERLRRIGDQYDRWVLEVETTVTGAGAGFEDGPAWHVEMGASAEQQRDLQRRLDEVAGT